MKCGRKKGCVPWNKGKRGLQIAWNKNVRGYKIHSEEHKRALHERVFPDEIKKKISMAGKKRYSNPEERRMARIRTIKQHRKNGIDFPAVDAGANDYFQRLNICCGTHIQYPNIEIKDLGYFLDGYDEVTNSVYEYDTKSHNLSNKKGKDLIRQEEIINYYKSIGKPLSAFYRVNVTGIGPVEMKDVLNKQNTPVGV